VMGRVSSRIHPGLHRWRCRHCLGRAAPDHQNKPRVGLVPSTRRTVPGAVNNQPMNLLRKERQTFAGGGFPGRAKVIAACAEAASTCNLFGGTGSLEMPISDLLFWVTVGKRVNDHGRRW